MPAIRRKVLTRCEQDLKLEGVFMARSCKSTIGPTVEIGYIRSIRTNRGAAMERG